MKTSLIKPTPLVRNGQVYGYPLRRDKLTAIDLEWLRNNLGNGGWFWSWDEGVVNRILYFTEYENLILFKLACGECDK